MFKRTKTTPRVPRRTLIPMRPGQARKMRVAPSGQLVMRPPDPTGVKALMVRIGKAEVRTPYGIKEVSRRRAARKVAHESRRRNR